MIHFTDTHCHLTLPQFVPDRFEIIQGAINKGICKILIPGIDFQSSVEAIKLCALYPKVLYAAIGIHPNTTGDLEQELKSIYSLSTQKPVVAIGEIGLDYYRQMNSKQVQMNILEQQLNFASERHLPVCIHNREASVDIIEILENWVNKQKNGLSGKVRGVFHSFSGNLQFAQKIIELGFMLGISGPITYPKNSNLAELIFKIGIENLVVETDAPYLAPQLYRGKRNLPEYVIQVIQKLSIIFELPMEKICQITNDNAARLFQWQE